MTKEKDIHKMTASEMYGVPVEEVTEAQRFEAKRANFLSMYSSPRPFTAEDYNRITTKGLGRIRLSLINQGIELDPENAVLRLKDQHSMTWRDRSEWFWAWRMFLEMFELFRALLGIHKHTPDLELTQIAATCINWLEMRDDKTK